ncbi:MAG: hypothetical protein IJ416_06445 [Ruminiclostridium sp.]|nr:hypothetical protein [Ruminiclostridium sp.]
MKNKKFSLNLFLMENAVPILLFTALFSSVIYIYSLSDAFVFTSMSLVAFVYGVAIFLLFDFLKRKNKTLLSTIVLFVVLSITVSAGSSFIETTMVDTTQWFFEPGNFTQIYTGNILAVILMFGFVMGAALYYFTLIRFRSVFVFLICMCPFSLFAKSFTDIPVIFTIVIITLFFLLLISHNTEQRAFSGKNRYAAIASFIVVVSAGAAFLPKLEYAPYREEFDELITGINIAGGNAVNFNDFSNSSSYSRSDDDEVLFRFHGDNPVYLKRQCFDYYNSKTDLWEYYGDVNTGYNYYNDYISWENPALLAAETGVDMKTQEKFTIVSSEQGNVRAVYTPENIKSIEFSYSSLSDYGERYVYRTDIDEYFVSASEAIYSSYTVRWTDFDLDIEFMLNYDEEKAKETGGYYSSRYYESMQKMKEYHEPLMRESVRRESYGSDADYQRVKTLVHKITEGCTNAYEKAVAIEQYFKSDDFVYDDEFSVTDGSVENFLFNTKRGLCADYATAMTLMCREAGLYSRYVEGFLVQKADENGVFYVTAADGHAYVQVWLDGYGWTDFDPTSNNVDNGGYIDPTFLAVGTLMLLIGAGVVLFFIVRPIAVENSFVKRVSALRGSEQLMKLYPRVSETVHRELAFRNSVLTVSELKKATFDNFGVDISQLADDFERTAYGNIDCGSKDYMIFYTDLKKAIRLKKAEEQKAKRHRR